MKRFSLLSLALAAAGTLFPARAQEYRFFPAPNAPTGHTNLNAVTHDGTGFLYVGADARFARSAGQPGAGPGQPGLGWQTVTANGATGSNLTAVVRHAGFVFVGAGALEGLNSSGLLFRSLWDPTAVAATLAPVTNNPDVNFGHVTDLVVSDTNLVRLGNRFVIGYHNLANLEGSAPLPALRTDNVSPFFENYGRGVQLGNRLFVGGSYIGELDPRGAISFSTNAGVSITPNTNTTPQNGVTLFPHLFTGKITSLATDGINLYAAGTSNFLAVLPDAIHLTVPIQISTGWLVTNTGIGSSTTITNITSMAVQGDSVYLVGANGVERRQLGTNFVRALPAYITNLTAISLASANNAGSPYQDLVVGVGPAGVIVGGPVPLPPTVTLQRIHFIDSDATDVVTVTNPTNTVTETSLAYDFYKDSLSGSPFKTVGPATVSPDRAFDLAALPTSVFNYGTNTFLIVARDTRTALTSLPVTLTVYRWPNPQPPQLGRVAGVAESPHFFQVGTNYSGVSSLLIPTDLPIPDNGVGIPLDVNTVAANWYQLPTAIGQGDANEIRTTNVINGLTALANLTTSLPFGSLPVLTNLSVGVHTFAVQAVAHFPDSLGGITNSLSTNVTLFNVVVLAAPAAPRVNFLKWTVGACQGSVISRLLPSPNGDWDTARRNPAAAGAANFVANITLANWADVINNATSATLPIDPAVTVPRTDNYTVQSVSHNRDGGDSLSPTLTPVAVTIRPTPQSPVLLLANVPVGSAGVVSPVNYTIPSANSLRIKVGAGVTGTLPIRPAAALELVVAQTQLEWAETFVLGASSSSTNAINRFDSPFNLGIPDAGLYTVTVRARNYYTNAEDSLNGALVETRPVVTDCASPGVTTLTVEVTERPNAPGVTATDVAVYAGVDITYADNGSPANLLIGQEARRPLYAVQAQTNPGVGGVAGSVSTTGDWYLADAGGTPTTLLLANQTSFRPGAEAKDPGTYRYVVIARTTDGALSTTGTLLTLVITPLPTAPALLSGGFFTYENGVLKPQDNVSVPNGSTLTVADDVGNGAPRRPTYSMVAQVNATTADWYVIVGGVTNRLVSNATSFTPTPAQAPVGTNKFYAIARSIEGSQSLQSTAFTLVVTPLPAAPELLAGGYYNYVNGALVLLNNQPVANGGTVTVADDAGQPPRRPTFAMVPQVNATTADWYALVAGVPVQVAANVASFTPTPGQAPVGTSRFRAISRSAQGASSVQPTDFTVVVTALPTIPEILAADFYTYDTGGILTLRSNVTVPEGGKITVADFTGDTNRLRATFSLVPQNNATTADWYVIVSGKTNLLSLSTADFRPSTNDAPVGTNHFIAIARSSQGASSPPTDFTLVVTPLPDAPEMVAGNFYAYPGGVLTLQFNVAVELPDRTLTVGDDVGNGGPRRPTFTMVPQGNTTNADWYVVLPNATNQLGTNTASFTPTPDQSPVGANHYYAIARSSEGARSPEATDFTLVVTARPAAPALEAGGFYNYVAGVLTLQNNVPVADGGSLTIADDVGKAPRRPTFSMLAQGNATTADWYAVSGGTSNLLASHAATFTPTLAQSPVGTSQFLAIARSTEGSSSAQATEFTLVVTQLPGAPEILAGGFYTYANGDLKAQSQVPVANGGTLTVADDVGKAPRRPTFSMVAQANATTADWYSVVGAVSNLLAANVANFTPTLVQTPVGTSRFVAVARTSQGASSQQGSSFSLVVTALPDAPEVFAGNFYSYSGGVLTLLFNVAVDLGDPTVTVADDVGNGGPRRPTFSLAPQGNATTADWYAVTGATSNRLAANVAAFTPTLAQSPVGTTHFRAITRSAQGGSSPEGTDFSLVVTAAPGLPVITGTLPSVSANGLVVTTLTRNIVASETISVGTLATPPSFTVQAVPGMVPGFTRWSTNGAAGPTSATFTPAHVAGVTAVQAVTYSAEGMPGLAIAFMVEVTSRPGAPSVANASQTLGACDTRATFTASSSGLASVVWTGTPDFNTQRLATNASYTTPDGLVAAAATYKYYAWAVSTNGDSSVTPTLVELTVTAAPPAAELTGLTQIGGNYVWAVMVDAAAYPELAVLNAGPGLSVEWQHDGTNIAKGLTFTPSIVDLPTSNEVAGAIGPVIVRTHLIQVSMIRDHCTNTSAQVELRVYHPFLTLTNATPGSLTLHFNTADDLANRKAELLSTNNLVSLAAGVGPFTTNLVTLTAPIGTNAIGLKQYLVLTGTAGDTNIYYRLNVLASEAPGVNP